MLLKDKYFSNKYITRIESGEIVKVQKLTKLVKKKGIQNSILISTEDIVIENRVPLLCRFGCDDFGRKLTCPPFSPTPEEFRKYLGDYEKALLLIFKCPAELSKDSASRLMSLTQFDKNAEVKTFWKDWYSWKRKAYENMLSIDGFA